LSNHRTDTKAPSLCATITREGWLAPGNRQAHAEEVHALVVAWSLEEPDRVGEVALFGDGSPAQILGRGGPSPEDDAPRVRFVRHRLATHEERPHLAAPGLSRRQLLLTPGTAGIVFERTGRCEVSHNGTVTDRGLLRAGDVLMLQNQLVIFCTRRRVGHAGSAGADGHAFGGPDCDGVVGESEAAWRLRAELALVAPSDAHVLVLGPSGAGKELAARAIHRLSRRSSAALVARSAAAIPATLLDAELFGNRRDYPNSGMPERDGVVGAADGGTLFLDEIGELGPELQTHLLRLLDTGGEYHRLGESRVRRSDIRFVAATNRDPSELKHDFAARFAIRITVPGLDARREDIPLLARHLLDDAVRERPDLRKRFFERGRAGEVARLDPKLVQALLRWPWSTHVRELKTLLWCSIRASEEHYLVVPPEMRDQPRPEATEDGEEPSAQQIRDALVRNQGSRSRAYVELGLPSRFALYRLIRRHGIDLRGLEDDA
jgi:Sigma-54 interaction domain